MHPSKLTSCILAAAALIATAPHAHADCPIITSGASVTYQTPAGRPVVYVTRQCSKYRFPQTYYDLDGRQWDKARLVPSQRHRLNDVVEAMATNHAIDLNADLDDRILLIAICRDIIPRPDDFHIPCS